MELCSIVANSELGETKEFSRSTAEKIALAYLSAAELKSIHDSTKLLTAKPFLLLLSGKIYLAQQNYKLARETFTQIIRLYPDSYEKKEASKLADETLKSEKFIDKSDIVGVILPLSSIYHQPQLLQRYWKELNLLYPNIIKGVKTRLEY